MIEDQFLFQDVTLLVTHYNRSASLERLLATFKKLGCTFEAIVVSDDGSAPEHLEKIRSLQAIYTFRLITTPVNKGLGNNINKGQDAVTTPFTLYIQEDFIPQKDFPPRLREALQLMKERPYLDIARFYAYFKYPYLKPVGNGFSEMNFKLAYPGYKKFYAYSDHPHLRRGNFLEKFGRYKEGRNVDVTEFNMMMSFLRNKGKALYYDDCRSLFEQKNTEKEPSTIKRNYWRETDNPAVKAIRNLYRHLKFNWSYFFLK